MSRSNEVLLFENNPADIRHFEVTQYYYHTFTKAEIAAAWTEPDDNEETVIQRLVGETAGPCCDAEDIVEVAQ